MLYVIEYCYLNDFEDDNSGISRVLKVGYSSDFDHRYQQYCICRDKSLRVLFKIDGGTMEDEQSLHRYLKETFQQLPELGREWYEKTKEIIEFFSNNTDINKIREIIVSSNRLVKVSQLLLTTLKDEFPNIDIESKLRIKATTRIIDIEKTIDNLIKDRVLILFGPDSFNRFLETYDRKINVYLGNKNEIDNFMNEFRSTKLFYYKMKLLCTANLSSSALSIVLDLIPEYFKLFYISLGPNRCRKLYYKYSKLKAELENMRIDKDLLLSTIYSEFKVGDKISKSEIKDKLFKIYNDLGLVKTPKATDLNEWFDISTTKVQVNDKKIEAFKIIKKKELGED